MPFNRDPRFGTPGIPRREPQSLQQLLAEMMGGTPDQSLGDVALDRLDDLGSQIRYGVPANGPEGRDALIRGGGIPGLYDKDPLNPETNRYASNYLGTKKWGPLPPLAFNSVRSLIDHMLGAKQSFKAGLSGSARAMLEPSEETWWGGDVPVPAPRQY